MVDRRSGTSLLLGVMNQHGETRRPLNFKIAEAAFGGPDKLLTANPKFVRSTGICPSGRRGITSR
jgi:hypothetical protein